MRLQVHHSWGSTVWPVPLAVHWLLVRCSGMFAVVAVDCLVSIVTCKALYAREQQYNPDDGEYPAINGDKTEQQKVRAY
jgi:hypothetical protein